MKKIIVFAFFMLQVTLLKASDFYLIENNKGADIYYAGNEPVVNTAIDIFIGDSKLVSTEPTQKVNSIGDKTIIVGVLSKEPQIKQLLSQYNIDVSDIENRWEGFNIQSIQKNDNSYLFVIGSDPRGAAYGVLELSRQIGVSPWVWWADAVPGKRNNVAIVSDTNVQSPSVQYRGIFLNDEDWALMPWSTHTFEPTATQGAIGPKTYAKIFELLLRLRANTIWPAMHECTVPFFLVEGNKEIAEKYGIIVSSSHAEPMMRTNTGEWNNDKYGDFNFLTNKNNVLSYWEERVKSLSCSENIYTIGMRGIHDGRMQGVRSLDEETEVLCRVIKEQRDMLKRHNPDKDLTEIPQQFVPYKEVLKAYDNGLELSEDIALVWCDDNHGYIMRLSNPEEQKRPGGAGVYYHISYWGKPHDYLWIASTQPGLIYTEMKRAWDNNARRLWILNVGDIKPGEYLTEFFLDMAWDISALSGNTIYAHQKKWIATIFGEAASEEIEYILRQYYQLAGHRKPEHMGWNKVEDWNLRKIEPSNRYGLQPVKDSEFSPLVFGDEIERRIEAYNNISVLSSQMYREKIPDGLKPAYFQLIHYPVAASSAMNRKILYAQKARFYTENDVALARYYANQATNAYNEITALDYTYNKDLLNGKWDGMMDMKPRDLPVFQQAVLPTFSTNTLHANNTLSIPKALALINTAGTTKEGDQMIALNASDYTNNIELETIECLGHSGKAVRLPKAGTIHPEQPHLEYNVTTTSSGATKIKVGTIPMHPVHGNTKMRYAIVIDKQAPLIVSTAAEFLSDMWEENTLRNQCLTISDAIIAQPGEHTIRIYALDEEIVFDQLMLEFNLDRKHYLIPIGK